MNNSNLLNAVQGQSSDVNAMTSEIELAIIAAANNARRVAELRHDFADCHKTGKATLAAGASLDLNSVELDLAYTAEAGTYRSFKTVKAVYLRDTTTNVLSPLKVRSRQTAMIHQMRTDGLSNDSRYPGEQSVSSEELNVIINGRRLFLQPALTSGSIDIAIDGSVWMDDYTGDESTDFILDRGFEYMQWACICELNHMLLKFVPRQEGTLSPPTNARDLALDALITNDSYSVDGNIYHDL